MAEIIPFKSVRPTRDKVHLVASRSYITYKPKQLSRKLKENPFSFIHIINPDFKKKKQLPPLSTERFKRVKAKYAEFVDHGYLEPEAEPCIYIYRQVTPKAVFTGFVCGVNVQEYLDGKIKIHEQTITSRVDVFSKYLDVCDFNAEPVLLTYKDGTTDFADLLKTICHERPEYDFTTTDHVRHELWPVSDKELIGRIQEQFGTLDTLYIADGHHRMASSANLSESRKKRHKDWSEKDICNFALALIIPESILSIEAFHRVLNLDEPLNEADLLEKLSHAYECVKFDGIFIPETNHQFGMRLASGWYALRLKKPVDSKSPVDQIDPMVLTQTILEPIFGIMDQKTDQRIDFIPENQSLNKLEKKLEQGGLSVIFTMHPLSTRELFAVADANEIMPPKSTYIEPKLRSGLTIMNLSETKLL